MLALVVSAQDGDGVALGGGREVGVDALGVVDRMVASNLQLIRLVDVERVKVQTDLADPVIHPADLENHTISRLGFFCNESK